MELYYDQLCTAYSAIFLYWPVPPSILGLKLHFGMKKPAAIFRQEIACISPAEIQDDLAIASIENVFVYSDRYGHSDIRYN